MEEEKRDQPAKINDHDTTETDLHSILENERAKAERYMANWRRAEADFDNYKKRVEQEKIENTKFANAALILNLLPVLDDLDRAFKALPEKLAQLTWTDGIRLIHRKLQAILEAQGVTEIKTIGEIFDPHIHEAVGQIAGDDGKIIEEVQKGYKLHGRVIRPAFVIVGNAKQIDSEPEPSAGSDDSGG